MKRGDVTPGRQATVKVGHTLLLNPHLVLSVKPGQLTSGKQLIVVTLPRKKDNINLVRVRVLSAPENQEYECYYCDVLQHCETT